MRQRKRICIFDITESFHPTFVETLLQIYDDEAYEIVLLIHSSCYKIIQDKISQRVVELKLNSDFENEKAVFSWIAKNNIDKLLIVTLEPSWKYTNKYIVELLKSELNIPIYYVLHNIDQWFRKSTIKRVWELYTNAKGLKDFSHMMKQLWMNFKSKEIVDMVLKTQGKFIVFSELLKTNVSEFMQADRVVVVPFALPDPEMAIVERTPNKKLHVLVPGNVAQIRRDYIAFLMALKQHLNLSDKLIVEFLGKIPNEYQKEEIVQLITELKSLGFELISYGDDYLPMSVYDQRMKTCDMVLALLNSEKKEFVKYGFNKESGFIFSMIRYLKPGLVPDFYPVADENKEVVVYYKNIDDLMNLLSQFSNSSDALKPYSEAAQQLKDVYRSEKFLKVLERI